MLKSIRDKAKVTTIGNAPPDQTLCPRAQFCWKGANEGFRFGHWQGAPWLGRANAARLEHFFSLVSLTDDQILIAQERRRALFLRRSHA
jgi:hypothetical protein